jgi:hypothetical protein
MSWKARIGWIAAGLLAFFIASSQLQAGKFVFENASYRQTTFAWSGYGVGAVLILIAFLPPSDWVNKYLARKKSEHRRSKWRILIPR